jgi:peptide/nickel transport system permease protein
VRELIAEKLPNTFLLNSMAFLLAALVGVPLGAWSASRAGRLGEKASAAGLFLLYSLPSFWVALLLMQWLAVRLDILPLYGMSSDLSQELSPAAQVADRLRHMVLPVICLTYSQLAIFARFTKGALTDVIRQDYITAARARGAGESSILWRHAFRNALMPLVTLFGLTIPYLISGSVIVEQIFQWDGVGLLYLRSILSRDYPVVMGLTVVTAIVTLVASVLSDVLYALVDPRVRMGDGR